MAGISQTPYFRYHRTKNRIILWYYSEVKSQMPNWKWMIFGVWNGLVSNSRQADTDGYQDHPLAILHYPAK